MKFSVVGLPHYTIWHLYEPSIDDIRHMEEMEQERQAREAEEKEKAERAKLIKEQFKDPKAEWESDGAAMKEILRKEEQESSDTAKGGEAGPAAPPPDKETPRDGDKT
jgi:mannan polymerase II complex ANP1 subunit